MTDNVEKVVLIVCGPTASGKSALALDVATEFDGVVINADSMQVYRELRILTARPSPDKEALVPHRLYGFVSVHDIFSAGRWRDFAIAEIQAAHVAGRIPVICGGTGLYLKSLMEGLSRIPSIPEDVRRRVREKTVVLGAKSAHAVLARIDLKTAARIDPGDTQRISRALEVFEATGRPLADWQADTLSGPDPAWHFTVVLLTPQREILNAAINTRLRNMVDAGALEEVASLDGFDNGLPALKALGVPDLRRHLRGEIELEAAISFAQTATRQFAKRQVTWFKNKIIADYTITAQYSKSFKQEIFSFIRDNVLTQSD